MSPTTLRYIKVLSDLERLFGDLTDKRIAEIGVGYGGQCRLVTSHWRVRSYTLIDLAPALNLARVYLEQYATGNSAAPTPLVFKAANDDITGEFELCISNYAFTELSREAQIRYVAMVVQRSRAGYMTCNFISKGFGIDSMTPDELIALGPGAEWLPEEPLTHPDNRILVWGHRSQR